MSHDPEPDGPAPERDGSPRDGSPDPTEPHPLLAKARKMFDGMDEIRAMYPTPEARTAAGIEEDGWRAMEEVEVKLREAFAQAEAADRECMRQNLAAREASAAAREEQARAEEALRDAFGHLLN